MIKKSVFEADLIAGMQRELANSFEKKAGMNDLTKAVDYLQSAVEIFEEAGMTAKADQVLRILGKIAVGQRKDVQQIPNIQQLFDAGITPEDLKNLSDPTARARVNTAFRLVGYSEKDMKHFLGNNYMSENEAADVLDPERPYGQITDWLQNPSKPVNPDNLQPGEEITFKSIAQESKPQKPKNPTTVSDSHTQGLTSEKMIDNLKDHGTVFNMADDGSMDSQDSEDLLELDLNEAAMEEFEDSPDDKTFEDSD